MQAREEGSPSPRVCVGLRMCVGCWLLVGCWFRCIWSRRGRVFAMLSFRALFIGGVLCFNVKFEIFF